MNSVVCLPLSPTPDQHQRLLALQREFARVCNALAPVVQETRTWNRVALHHLMYRRLRELFPQVGSQIVCNAIYAVSKSSRLVFQSPGSPFHHSRLIGKPLPRLSFSEACPVYLDRHTLSIKEGRASMYTLDGRMRFQLALSPQVEIAFHERRLHEVALQRRDDSFELFFSFGDESPVEDAMASVQAAPGGRVSRKRTAVVGIPGMAAAGVSAPALPAYLRVDITA